MPVSKKDKINFMPNISISIIAYNTDKILIRNAIESCVNSLFKVDIYLVDNSLNEKYSYFKNDKRVIYLKTENKGFGAGHNFAIKKMDLLKRYNYHLVLNPDISFEKHVIRNLFEYMEKYNDVGVIMPRILNTDKSLQFARRLLPSFLNVILKRSFLKLSRYTNYEMHNIEPKTPVEIIGLCGCFLFFRTKALKSVGLFDENYFMYFEDYDLCRRISIKYKTIYYPNCEVIHKGNHEHKRNIKLFFVGLISAIKYFYKWGLIDKKRKELNAITLKKVLQSSK
jgi:GT2 family glycosyltransferase